MNNQTIRDLLGNLAQWEESASLTVPSDYLISTIAFKLEKIKSAALDLEQLDFEAKLNYETGYIQSLLHMMHYRDIPVDSLLEKSGIGHICSKRRAIEKGISNKKITREEAKVLNS